MGIVMSIQRTKGCVLLSTPHLIKVFGRSSAQFIYQLHYWIEKGQGIVKDELRWIYNTANQWAEQLCLSSRQIERIIQKLKKDGIIKIEHFGKTNRVNYITLNYTALQSYFNQEDDKMSSSERQNVGMHNKESEITNKEDLNKSNSSTEISSINPTNVDFLNKEDFSKKVVVYEMLELWNQAFPQSQTKLTKDLSRSLGAVFKIKCQSNINEWKDYLSLIQSSSYLKSSSFNLSIYWAVKFLTIDRIKNGDFGVQRVEKNPPEEDLTDKVLTHIETVNEHQICKTVRSKIVRVIGNKAYLSWFTQLKMDYSDHRFRIYAESPFIRDYVLTHYGYLFMVE